MRCNEKTVANAAVTMPSVAAGAFHDERSMTMRVKFARNPYRIDLRSRAQAPRNPLRGYFFFFDSACFCM